MKTAQASPERDHIGNLAPCDWTNTGQETTDGRFKRVLSESDGMDSETAGRRKRDVTLEEFRRLLLRLNLDPMRAWREYAELRRKLVMFFGPGSQAVDLAEEVLDRIAKKPESEPIENITEFAVGIARNLRREFWRKTSVTMQMPEGVDLPDQDHDPESSILEAIDGGRRRECFLQCMKQLDPEDGRLIVAYHPGEFGKVEERRQELAVALGISGGALRSKVGRLRAALEACCMSCYRGAKPGK